MSVAVAVPDGSSGFGLRVDESCIKLWLLDLNEQPNASQREWLSTAEMDRASLFRDAADRRRYLAAHCALRVLIEDFAGIEAEEIEFAIGPLGKPSLYGISGIHFSLSYAGDRALVGMSSGADIGVDIEMLRTIEDADELADEYFTAEERNTLFSAKTGADRQQSFLQGWTRKEACIKAVGLGLSLHPATFMSGVSGERMVAALPLPDGTVFAEVRTISLGPDMIAACSVISQRSAHPWE